jgi:hypothetical protein
MFLCYAIDADAAAQSAASGAKDAEQRAAVANSTVRHLEDRLKDRETAVARLEQEKSKLESYARRTLTAFKDKYMAVLQTMRTEKQALEERVAYLVSRHEQNQAGTSLDSPTPVGILAFVTEIFLAFLSQETARKEERVLMSAMYEVNSDSDSHHTILFVYSSAHQPYVT